VPKLQLRERREWSGARLIRLQNTLMQIYANPENAHVSHRVRFDDDFGLLLQKWRDVRPKDLSPYHVERDASPSYRDYRDALRRVVGQRPELADEHGNALSWALDWVDRRVQLVASHWNTGEGWKGSQW
jgi:hypothetical protein